MTKRERLWEKVKTTIVNTKWTDVSLAAFAETALNCDECPAFAACDPFNELLRNTVCLAKSTR